jgi:hypothetical protein
MAQLKIDRMAKVLAFADACGKDGFLIADVAKLIHERKDVASNLVSRLVSRGNLRVAGSRLVERGSVGSVRVSVYQFVHNRLPDQPIYDSTKKPTNVFEYLAFFHHDEDWDPKEPEKATGAVPGSPEKIEVLRLRAERGEHLWHRRDTTNAHPRCEPMRVCHV